MSLTFIDPNYFATTLLTWYDQYGRKDLPWQQDINSYRVWISEIMLQQTQVKTVIPYFQRFLSRFPNVESLANAHEDEVLHLWTGLGYYARARNLHRTAKIIQQDYQGQFPTTLATVQALPGIGRSTAGAILAIANGQHTAILDGNVKRVLTRIHAISGWPGEPKITNQLWELAQHYTPKKRTAAYTQAIMDLGATLCTRSKPLCIACPFQSACQAYQANLQNKLPNPKPIKKLPIKSIKMLILCNTQQEVLLEKRPPTGIWGSLWGFPECAMDSNEKAWCEQKLGYQVIHIESWQTFRHTFSHFHLDILPIVIQVKPKSIRVMDSVDKVWYKITQEHTHGLAKPVKQLLTKLATELSQKETTDVT